MRVRSGRAFEPRRRQTLPLHGKLTQSLGERLALPFSPWSRVARTASVLLGTRLKPASDRPEPALPKPSSTERGARSSEHQAPMSERSALDRDSVLPLEVLAHQSVPAPAPEPQRKTPKPPRPRRVWLETDDDFASVAPPPLFALAPSDAPLVASTAPNPEESRIHRVAYRLASGVLFVGFGVLAGWTLRGHSDRADPTSDRTSAAAAAMAVPAAALKPAHVARPNPTPREMALPSLAAAAQTNTPERAPARVEVPVVTIVARPSLDATETEVEPHASSTGPASEAPTIEALPAFDAEAARQSIAAAEARLSVCRGPSDPSGTAAVVVRYAPSGRVTTATVESGPFVGTPAGGCIAATFRSTRVPPFAGDPVTVKRTVTLR